MTNDAVRPVRQKTPLVQGWIEVVPFLGAKAGDQFVPRPVVELLHRVKLDRCGGGVDGYSIRVAITASEMNS